MNVKTLAVYILHNLHNYYNTLYIPIQVYLSHPNQGTLHWVNQLH